MTQTCVLYDRDAAMREVLARDPISYVKRKPRLAALYRRCLVGLSKLDPTTLIDGRMPTRIVYDLDEHPSFKLVADGVRRRKANGELTRRLSALSMHGRSNIEDTAFGIACRILEFFEIGEGLAARGARGTP